MPVELEELLRSTAAEPAHPLDARGLVRRARRRQAARRTAAGATAAVAVLAGALVLPGALGPVERVDLAPGNPQEGAPASATPQPATQADPVAADLRAFPGALLFDQQALREVVDGELRERVWGPVRAAHHAPDGRIVFQALSDEGADIMVGDRDVEGVSVVPDDPASRVRLHGVLVVDGEPHVAFTRRERSGDGEEEWLVLRALDGDEERRVVQTGAMDSRLGALAFDGRQLVTASCHLQCTLELADLTGAGASRTLDMAPEVVRAAAFVQDALVLLVLAPSPDGTWLAEPQLVVVDPARGEELQRIPLPLGAAEWADGLLAPAGGSEVAVSLAELGGAPGSGRWVQPLVVDLAASDRAPRRIPATGAFVPHP